ncbi:hypothetical protein C8Q80DRAFT_1108844 [Daedaleopsis nitida]|nr:hypothetical protein C8Q80DRAFT_1108844 [Daedaleopsis nitida]
MKAGSDEDASASLAGPIPKRDKEFWFEDGTVILIARDAEFRVYSGILASQSPVFRDLLSQSPPIRTVSINGAHHVPCPLLNVSDTPEDLRHMLRIYTPQGLGGTAVYDTKKPGFAEISACIRLGKKYQLAHLYDQSLRFLKGHYTDDFNTWGNLTRWALEGWADAEAIGVVNLARTVGELSLLPTAPLACAALRKGIARGFTRADGRQETLSPADLDTCFHAKTEVRKASLATLLRTLAYNPKCKEASACRLALRSVVKGLHDHVDRIIGDDPFCSHRGFLDDKPIGVCKMCDDALDALNRDGRLKMWNRLPELLGIEVPCWPVPVPAQDIAPAL